MDKLLCSKKEAASALGVSIRTVENFIARRELVARKLGRRTLIAITSIQAFARHDHKSPTREDNGGR